MASKSVPISITYASPGAMPPVYVAGDFTGWQAIEMDYTTKDGENHFFKEVHVNAGSKHQYKFRLGPGDWWVLNEDAPTVTDDLGNRNNVLDVPEQSSIEDDISEQAKKSDVPILVVEKVDDKPVHGEDMGKNATSGQKVAHEKRAEDAEPDIVIVRDESAKTASEVADTAAQLDREPSPAVVPAAEAGRVGERRMSSTPIKDVSRVASEVADSAALIDEGSEGPISTSKPVTAPTPIHPKTDFVPSVEFERRCDARLAEHAKTQNDEEEAEFEEGALERRLPHESIDFASIVEDQPVGKDRGEGRLSFSEYRQEPVYDVNDPTITILPTERNGFRAALEQIRLQSIQHNGEFDEDAGYKDEAVEDGNSSPSDSRSSRSSSKVLQPPTPVMDVISEEDEEDGPAERASIGRSLSDSLDGSSDEGPRGRSTTVSNPVEQMSASAAAVSTALSDDADKGLKARSGAVTGPERSVSAGVAVSGKGGEAPKGLLELIWRTIVVNWIGGFFSRILGGGNRRQLIYMSLAVAVGSALYLRKRT